jgi:hypothetical protein
VRLPAGTAPALLAGLLLLLPGPGRAEGGPGAGTAPAERFREANGAYEAGDFAGAETEYRDLLESGYREPEVYYNLAAALYKQGRLGRALASLHKARRLAPRDGDILYNLEFLRSLTRDKLLAGNRGPLESLFRKLHRSLTLSETLWIAFLLQAIAVLLLLGIVYWEAPFVRRLVRVLYFAHPLRFGGLRPRTVHRVHLALVLVLLGLAVVSAGTKIVGERMRTWAVVVRDEVDVTSGPGRDYTVEFVLHEGTEVALEEERGRWARIGLPGGLSGWVEREALESLRIGDGESGRETLRRG